MLALWAIGILSQLKDLFIFMLPELQYGLSFLDNASEI